MANSPRCTTCAGKRGKQVPGRCDECPTGTHRADAHLCPGCATKGGLRCESCKTNLPTPAHRHQPSDGMAGPTGFGGC